MNRAVGARQFRERASEYLLRAKQGEEIVILLHRRPAAIIRPAGDETMGVLVPASDVRDRLHEMVGESQKAPLLITWYGRACAVMEPAPASLELPKEDWW